MRKKGLKSVEEKSDRVARTLLRSARNSCGSPFGIAALQRGLIERSTRFSFSISGFDFAQAEKEKSINDDKSINDFLRLIFICKYFTQKDCRVKPDNNNFT